MAADPAFLGNLDSVDDSLAAFDLFDDLDTTNAKKARFERIEKAKKEAALNYRANFQEPNWFLDDQSNNTRDQKRNKALHLARVDYYYLNRKFERGLEICLDLIRSNDTGNESELCDLTLRCALRAAVYTHELVEVARRYKDYEKAAPGFGTTAALYLSQCPTDLVERNEALRVALTVLGTSSSIEGARRVLRDELAKRSPPVLAVLVEQPSGTRTKEKGEIESAIEKLELDDKHRKTLEKIISLDGQQQPQEEENVGRNVRSL